MTEKPFAAPELSTEEQAREILKSEQFFRLFLDALRRERLVGEERNALVLYIVALSSLLDDPLNAIIKGASSAGKNFLAKNVLRFFPDDAIREITSSSDMAWNYIEDNCEHKVIYLQERNEAAGNIHPVRLLISDKKLVRQVKVGKTVQDFVTNGPISSISTTTRNVLEIDDESRHISLWTDQSPEQTLRIAVRSVARYLPQDDAEQGPLSDQELAAWQQVYSLIRQRAKRPVTLAAWFKVVAKRINTGSVVSRRYFPAFIEACRTIALIRSFESVSEWEPGRVEVSFEDFCIAAILFEDVFVASLQRGSDDDLNTATAVQEISERDGEIGADAEALAAHLNISTDRAYRMLRDALDAGAIVRANGPEKANAKLYIRTPQARFLPRPEDLLGEISEIPSPVQFIHPLTGDLTSLVRKIGSPEKPAASELAGRKTPRSNPRPRKKYR